MPTKRHFHSIDALRFFAFFKVFLQHTPIQGDFPIFNYLKNGGGIGVAFFFVLSGFLITYLLVHDKFVNEQISPKKFLIRRTLRIWPLFFLAVLIAFLLPYDFKSAIGFHMVGGGYEFDWRFSFTFLENYNMLLIDNFPKTTPLSVFWSLCIEEHFYLFWMVMLYLIPKRYIFQFLWICIPFAWFARGLESFIFDNQRMYEIDLFTTLDLFAIGGLLGYYAAIKYEKLTGYILSIPTLGRYIIILSVVTLVIFEDHLIPDQIYSTFNWFRNTLIALSFTALIAVFIPHNSTIQLRSKTLAYLGQISYGLYVYHIIVIHVMFKYFIEHQIVIDNIKTLTFFMVCTFSLSVFISHFSYQYFELPFLKLREKITR